MFKLSRPLRRMFIAAGLLAVATLSNALPSDGQIAINKAPNSPTLTIRYSSANAALVELRINGESVATRSVSAGKSSGETTFDVNIGTLRSGDNEVEVRLFDKSGRLIGSEKTVLTADQEPSLIFLTSPKMGATISGNVEIKIGFGKEFKNSYVSFFIDNQFKSISNVAPYSFFWDTTRDTNGWHEVEAWVVDDASTTLKTRKVRVFVNNPGGRSPRQGLNDVKPAEAPATPAKAPVKPAKQPVVQPKPIEAPKALPVVEKKPEFKPVDVEPLANGLALSVAGANGSKPAQPSSSISTGPKVMTPTGTRLALQKAPPVTTLSHATTAATTISISKGQRLPNLGSYAIVFNTQFVNFDVQPRISNGVPLTPFRHLIEKAGGKVDWKNSSKSVEAEAEGKSIFLKIGERFATINKMSIELENAPFLESGRTIVPLSFMKDALDVNIDYDKKTGHVLITSAKK